MTCLAVYVATTGGPVHVQRITPEWAPQSMVCLGRSSEVLPISGDYDDFVRPGSGVIMREFGPYEEGAFRLDVSGPIGNGRSWQLAIYAAHAIEHDEQTELSEPDSAETILWLTGMVDYDLQVSPIDHLAEKIEASQELFKEWIAMGKRVIAAVPEGRNADELKDLGLPEGVTPFAVQSVNDLLKTIDLGEGTTLPATPVELLPAKKKSSGLTVFALFGAATAALAFLFLTNEKPTPPQPKPEIAKPAKKVEQPKVVAPKTEVQKKLALTLTSERGENPVYRFGDELKFSLSLTQDAWVNCFYYQADGNVIQIFPNPHIRVGRLEGGKRYEIPSADTFPFKLQMSEPAGSETIVCFATKEDLTAKLPGSVKGDYVKPLPSAIAADLPRIFQALGSDTLAIADLPMTVKP